MLQRIAVILTVSGIAAPTPGWPPPPHIQPGSAGSGLRIDISAKSISTSHGEFLITFHNPSDADFFVNLGLMLGNGRRMWPTSIEFLLTDRNGRRRHLQFADPQSGVIGGRIDDFLVPLRAGASYTIPVSLDHYFDLPSGGVGVTLAPGQYEIVAHFDGHDPSHVNLDTQGIALLNMWKGTIESEGLRFDVPSR